MLEVQHISKSYEGHPVLQDVTFTVARGETVCLLAPSGGGKSTLLRIIAGLEMSDSGRILWQGEEITLVPPHRRGFGLMFQDYALFPHMTVWENVAFGLRMQGLPREEIQQRVTEALQRVNVLEFASRRVTDLSGGEQQRVVLARTLAPRPALLMLDEPWVRWTGRSVSNCWRTCATSCGRRTRRPFTSPTTRRKPSPLLIASSS